MNTSHVVNAKEKRIFNLIRTEIKNDPTFKKRIQKKMSLLKAILFATALTVCYWQIMSTGNFLLLLISYLIFGLLGTLIAFNFSHELSHNTVFKSRKTNGFFYQLSFLIVGAHSEGWKHRHIHAHHFAPNVNGFDPDLDLSNIIRVLPKSEYKWFHRYQHFYAPFAYMTYTLFWVFIKDFVLLFNREKRGYDLTPKLVLSFLVQKSLYVVYLIAIPAWFSGFSVTTIIVCFLAMHCFQSLFLLFTFFMTHHVEHSQYPEIEENGLINQSWFMNQINSSNDMNPFSHFTTFVLGGFNNHIAHHLFPTIHHAHYVKLSKIIYRVLNENGINPPYTSYFGGIRSHLRLLKLRSKTIVG